MFLQKKRTTRCDSRSLPESCHGFVLFLCPCGFYGTLILEALPSETLLCFRTHSLLLRIPLADQPIILSLINTMGIIIVFVFKSGNKPKGQLVTVKHSIISGLQVLELLVQHALHFSLTNPPLLLPLPLLTGRLAVRNSFFLHGAERRLSFNLGVLLSASQVGFPRELGMRAIVRENDLPFLPKLGLA